MRVLVLTGDPTFTFLVAKKTGCNGIQARFATTDADMKGFLQEWDGNPDAIVFDPHNGFEGDRHGIALYDRIHTSIRPDTKFLAVPRNDNATPELVRAMRDRGIPFVDINDFNPATQLL